MTSSEKGGAGHGASAPRQAGRTALWSWVAVAVLVTGLVQIDIQLPLIGHVGGALIALVFLLIPMVIADRRGEDLVDFGLVAQPIRRGLVLTAVAFALLFPLFTLGYVGFYELLCDAGPLATLAPAGMCERYGGLSSVELPVFSWSLDQNANQLTLGACAVQLFAVALPEELFFRGFLLRLLEERWPPKRRIFGGGVGLALIVSAAAFALIHLPKDGDPRALATFFPGLLFGWMRSATGSILASTITHAGSNLLVRALDLMTMR